MESPVVVDKPPEYHGNANDRGFPFDDEEGSGAWSELASRHPDIAARLRQRPASATWARKRRPSSQDTEDFGDSFGGFDRFPFDDIPTEFRDHFPTHWNRRFSSRDEQPPPPSQPQPQTSQLPAQNQTAATQTEVGPEHPPQEQSLPQYGLRNTVDLGQKSPADPSLVDADDRNQRSMSAPPDNRTQNQPKMSAQNHQEQPRAEHTSNVRVIPIVVEGRDEPVINKSADHAHFSDSKPTYVPPPQPHIDRDQYFTEDGPGYSHPPNFSKAFGGPGPFNKFRQGPQPFVHQKVYPQSAAFARGASPQRSQSPKPHQEEHFVHVPVHHENTAQKAEAPRSQPKHQQQPPQQQPKQPPQQQPKQPPQQSPPQPEPQQASPPPKPQPTPHDPITQILAIQTDVLNLMTDVENFKGAKKDKHYVYLDEMLTRNLIKLDNIETDGKENIRQARREAIKCIQKCIAVLEAKAESNAASAPKPQEVVMVENTAQKAAENGELEMTEPSKDAKVESQLEQPVVQEEKPQESKDTPIENTEVPPEAADTRPEVKTEDKEQIEGQKDSPKKGGKSVKKHDKSKDNKDAPKDSNKDLNVEDKEKTEVMQLDDKGDKPDSQTMEVDPSQ